MNEYTYFVHILQLISSAKLELSRSNPSCRLFENHSSITLVSQSLKLYFRSCFSLFRKWVKIGLKRVSVVDINGLGNW